MNAKDTRFSSIAYICALMLVASSFTLSANGAIRTNSRVEGKVAKAHLQRVVSCLISNEPFRDYALKFDNLKLGDFALAKYHSGSIVDKSYSGKVYNIVLYSGDMKKAVIGLVLPHSNGSLEVVQNGYLLINRAGKWSVDEGNGGFHDYEVVGNFVTSISHKPYSRVHLVSQPSACLE